MVQINKDKDRRPRNKTNHLWFRLLSMTFCNNFLSCEFVLVAFLKDGCWLLLIFFSLVTSKSLTRERWPSFYLCGVLSCGFGWESRPVVKRWVAFYFIFLCNGLISGPASGQRVRSVIHYSVIVTFANVTFINDCFI